jgi:ferrochelatase
MPTPQSLPQEKHGLSESTGVLVVNLGTPDAPTTIAVRRFLKQFLSDPHVIEYPRLIWWLVLNLVILQIRPSRSAAAYRKIWTEEGSPLRIHSADIAAGLQRQLDSRAGEQVHVELAMNYGKPSIVSAINRLQDKGALRILTLPLYPQYSRTTTASVLDSVEHITGALQQVPKLRFVDNYHDAPGYIAALAASVSEDWAKNGRGDKLLLSFHGVPMSTVDRGDPYLEQCRQTASLLAEALALNEDDWALSFQSRVGREEWLRPYTDETIANLGNRALSRLDVVCPGFPADCLETLEEIAMRNADLFAKSGGGSLHYIPALNAREDHASFLADLVEQQLLGWPE